MKKIVILLVIASSFVTCQKETSKPNNTSDNTKNNSSTTSDSTKNITNDDSLFNYICYDVKIEGTLTKGDLANNVSATFNYVYLGDKTQVYPSNTFHSTGVTGLTATLQAGKIESFVDGILVYSITGTPLSAGDANFEINFKGKTCSFSIIVNDSGKQGPNIIDIEGYKYKTVIIGTQHWMAENLKVSKYNDGTEIPFLSDTCKSLCQVTSPGWKYFGNISNNETYGKLYNWYAVSTTKNGSKNVCPLGWHIPTDDEWEILSNYLGGSNVAGGKMKEVGYLHWNTPNTNATNTSLFNGLPGGCSNLFGFCSLINQSGWWWSSTVDKSNDAWYRNLVYSSEKLGRFSDDKSSCISIRCLKD